MTWGPTDREMEGTSNDGGPREDGEDRRKEDESNV
jgi:hypothetical protein